MVESGGYDAFEGFEGDILARFIENAGAQNARGDFRRWGEGAWRHIKQNCSVGELLHQHREAPIGIVAHNRHHALGDFLLAAAAELDRRSESLERSNRDLEQFAYVASHDLQEPLRKVASFCQLLEQRYADELESYCTKNGWGYVRSLTSVSFEDLVLRVLRQHGLLR